MGIWNIGPTFGSIGNPFLIPIQYCESILKLFSFTEISCSNVAFVFISLAKLSSDAFSLSFSIRTDSRISLTSRCRLKNKYKFDRHFVKIASKASTWPNSRNRIYIKKNPRTDEWNCTSHPQHKMRNEH